MDKNTAVALPPDREKNLNLGGRARLGVTCITTGLEYTDEARWIRVQCVRYESGTHRGPILGPSIALGAHNVNEAIQS